MNILIIGNGFDLAHGLKTKYVDFLKFCKNFTDTNVISNLNIDKQQWDNLIKLLKNNLWIEHFYTCDTLKEGWIDFELEISRVIKKINDDYNKLNGNYGYMEVSTLNELDDIIDPRLKKSEKYDLVKLRKKLENDLKNLIDALELYMLYIVEKADINIYSPDVKEIKIDKILSFNYTHTYMKQYNDNVECNFIHGETDQNSNDNNMVLGIDDYTPENLISKDIEFIRFKKYFQRIHKKTGSEYKKWINKMAANNYSGNGFYHIGKKRNEVFIFGHSLDVTDKDILSEIILSDTVKTTIFYLDEEVYAQQIANLVKIIGKDKLIEKVSAIEPTIIFKKQQDMVPIN